MPETTPLIKAALNLRGGAGFDVYVPKNGMLETNKPLAMRVVGNALAYRKNLQCYNNAGSPTALQAEEVSIWI